MKKMLWIWIAFIWVASMPQLAAAAQEDEKTKPWEHFSLNIGGFVTTLNSDVRIDSKSGVGIDIDGENTLGLDSSMTVFRAEAVFRFPSSLRHRFDLGYFELRRNGTKTIQKDIEIRDQVFTAGARLDSSMDLKLIRGAYSYSFFQDDRFDLGVSVGAYVTPVTLSFKSSNLEGSEGRVSKTESSTLLLPVLGVRFDFAITPKLFLKQNIDLFYLEYEGSQASLVDARIALEYNIWRYLGLGVAYEVFHVQVESEKGDFLGLDYGGQLRVDYGGVFLYAKICY